MTMESHIFSQLSRKLRASLSRALPLVLLIRNIQRSLEMQSLTREQDVLFFDRAIFYLIKSTVGSNAASRQSLDPGKKLRKCAKLNLSLPRPASIAAC